MNPSHLFAASPVSAAVRPLISLDAAEDANPTQESQVWALLPGMRERKYLLRDYPHLLLADLVAGADCSGSSYVASRYTPQLSKLNTTADADSAPSASVVLWLSDVQAAVAQIGLERGFRYPPTAAQAITAIPLLSVQDSRSTFSSSPSCLHGRSALAIRVWTGLISGCFGFKPEQLTSSLAWSAYGFGALKCSPKGKRSLRSDNEWPDPVIPQAEQDMPWPDPENCNHPGTGSWPVSGSFQILISQPSGRTTMQWVRPSDLVQELKLKLECSLGIPSSILRLLSQGKQLEDSLPLSAYSISRNSLVVATLRLRGGAVGQSSSTRPFSYKDAVHSENPKSPVAPKSKVFLVDKIEEVPFVELIHEEMTSQLQDFAERAIICRFNGLWPRSQDLYSWIHANWTHHCKIFFCSKGYFIVLFDNSKHYEKALEEGPWFMGTAGLFLTPWFPEFDPANAVITKTPVWIRLPNLPAHLWSTRVFKAIGDTLGSFLSGDFGRESKGLYSYARICAELDLSKGLPEQINLKINDFVWTQTLDYENTAFRCRHCHQSGHLQNSCPSRPAKKNKANASKPKSKRWTPFSPPPVVDSGSSSSEDEDSDEDLEQAPHSVAPSADGLAPPSDSAIAQKRVHLSSSSDSEKEGFPKEGSPVEDPNLQVVIAHPPQNGWVVVKHRKGKKPRVEASTLTG